MNDNPPRRLPVDQHMLQTLLKSDTHCDLKVDSFSNKHAANVQRRADKVPCERFPPPPPFSKSAHTTNIHKMAVSSVSWF